MPTILVADDNSNIQKMVSLVFQEKGIRVVAVGNGEAACRKVPEVHPDVVLADVFMPVRNGYEVCEFVKHDPQFAEIPVILLVGAFDPLDEKEAQRVGANGVLKKPFVPPEPLIAMVSSLLGKIEPPVEEAPVAEAVLPPRMEMPAPQASAPATEAAPEFAFRSAPADYEETEDTAPAFGEPVATPASLKNREAEEEEEAEPENEWARRRATMDYEIDAADSANMVEKLAAEGTSEDAQILPGRKHLPFGGANVPEALRASREAESVDVETPPTAAAEPPAEQPEFEAPVTEKSTAEPSQGEWEPASSGSNSGPKMLAPRPIEATPFDPFEATPATADTEPKESSGRTDKTNLEGSVPAWAFPQTHQEREASTEPHIATASEEHEPVHAVPAYDHGSVWQDLSAQASEPLPSLPENATSPAKDKAETAPQESAITEAPVDEAPAGPQQVDQATVDDVVAKVISKLEPQLHQALANGVLRPLVEELLNKERDKK